MRLLVFAVVGAACLLPEAGAGPAGGPSPLERLRRSWQERKSLVVRFSQTQQFAGFDEPLESRGTLRILRPCCFDILYDPPSRQRQVCDGTTVHTYIPEQNQVLRTRLSPEATRSADLLDWALEGAALISAEPDPEMGEKGIRLDVTPGAQLPLSRLSIWIRDADAELLGYEAVDLEGNRTRMRILSLRPGKGLDPSDFVFEIPPGVEVVDMGEGR